MQNVESLRYSVEGSPRFIVSQVWVEKIPKDKKACTLTAIKASRLITNLEILNRMSRLGNHAMILIKFGL